MGHMTLTNDDRDWLDQKFGEVHTRITRVTMEQNAKLAEMDKAVTAHLATPCDDVKTHEETFHTIGVAKILAAAGAIVGILGGVAALVAYLK